MRILYLTFYFEPDLCAGSFRNTPLVKKLSENLAANDLIDVITTMPNRYASFSIPAKTYEEKGNVKVHRISIPTHKSGFLDQALSFKTYYSKAVELAKESQYDMVFASSSRLFTAFMGYRIAKRKSLPLYLDIRDIFTENMKELIGNPILRSLAMPVLNWVETRTFSYAKHINLVSRGFESHFNKYSKSTNSYFTNGIDEVFIGTVERNVDAKAYTLITYAGNIGEGQGLHNIVPQMAEMLGDGYRVQIIGDGGARNKLEWAIEKAQISNVIISKPMDRSGLIEEYQKSDYLFLHLNDYKAFEKVLPSKIFEYGAMCKPIIAGVAGFAKHFISEHLPDAIIFDPGDFKSVVSKLRSDKVEKVSRQKFIQTFAREQIMEEMSMDILDKIPKK